MAAAATFFIQVRGLEKKVLPRVAFQTNIYIESRLAKCSIVVVVVVWCLFCYCNFFSSQASKQASKKKKLSSFEAF